MDLDNQIEKIMAQFDWPKVANAMKALNWRWASVPNYEVPAVEDLQRCGRGLLEDLVRDYSQSKEWRFIKTGGLAARLYDYDDGPVLELAFELEDKSGEWF